MRRHTSDAWWTLVVLIVVAVLGQWSADLFVTRLVVPVDRAPVVPRVHAPPVPDYLKTLPTCPSVGSVTYSGKGFTSVSNPDAYTVVCSGSRHSAPRVEYTVVCAGVMHSGVTDSDLYPQYCDTRGLIER